MAPTTVSVYRLCENPDARSDEASRTAAVGLQPFFAPGFASQAAALPS